MEQSPPRERPRAAGRRGRLAEPSGRRGSPRARKAARSQSETSLLGRAHAAPPPPKYPTAERDEPRPPRPRRGPAPTPTVQACRRWRSTAEIDAPDSRRARAPRAPAPRGPAPSPSAPSRRLLYGCAGSDSECSAAGRPVPLGRRVPSSSGCGPGGGYGESESSASEGESPAFSSASSDSDGSGGLVWPQQLVAAAGASPSGPGGAAGVATPAGPAKVFVKIKASHALKKKILRFRSGSLKVMTTV